MQRILRFDQRAIHAADHQTGVFRTHRDGRIFQQGLFLDVDAQAGLVVAVKIAATKLRRARQ